MLHNLFNTLVRKQLRNRDASNRAETSERNHCIAMSTQNVGLHITNRYSQFLGDKGAETGRIENAGHTDDTFTRKAADMVGKLGHSVERIGDHDDDTVRRVLDDLLRHLRNDLLVLLDQIIARHAWFARKAG